MAVSVPREFKIRVWYRNLTGRDDFTLVVFQVGILLCSIWFWKGGCSLISCYVTKASLSTRNPGMNLTLRYGGASVHNRVLDSGTAVLWRLLPVTVQTTWILSVAPSQQLQAVCGSSPRTTQTLLAD